MTTALSEQDWLKLLGTLQAHIGMENGAPDALAMLAGSVELRERFARWLVSETGMRVEAHYGSFDTALIALERRSAVTNRLSNDVRRRLYEQTEDGAAVAVVDLRFARGTTLTQAHAYMHANGLRPATPAETIHRVSKRREDEWGTFLSVGTTLDDGDMLALMVLATDSEAVLMTVSMADNALPEDIVVTAVRVAKHVERPSPPPLPQRWREPASLTVDTRVVTVEEYL